MHACKKSYSQIWMEHIRLCRPIKKSDTRRHPEIMQKAYKKMRQQAGSISEMKKVSGQSNRTNTGRIATPKFQNEKTPQPNTVATTKNTDQHCGMPEKSPIVAAKSPAKISVGSLDKCHK